VWLAVLELCRSRAEMPKREQTRLANLTPKDIRGFARNPATARRIREQLPVQDRAAFDRALAELGTARKATKDHFQSLLDRLSRSRATVARYVGRVVSNSRLEEHDKWEFVLAAATHLKYIAAEGGAFDGIGSFTDLRGRAARLLVDAKHKGSAGLSLKFKDPRRQFERWAREGKSAVPCQVVFFKGGKQGRGVYIVPGIPLRTDVSFRDAAAGAWDPANPTRPMFIMTLGAMEDLSDPGILGRFQKAMSEAFSSIDAKKLGQQVEQDRRTFVASDTEKLMRSDQDRNLITRPVAKVARENRKARKELLQELAASDEVRKDTLAALAAADPALAKKLRQAGLID
jgi:hypothetical protein